MWCHFGMAMGAKVFRPRATKIPPVTILPMFYVGPKHEGRTKTVFAEKSLERLRHRDRPLVAVFWAERVCLTNVDQARFHIEPIWSGLNDLRLTETSMKCAVKNEFQILSLAL